MANPAPSAPPLALSGIAVHSPRALYETYNFHDLDALERLAAWLARPEDDDGPGVAVVAGRPGSGRDYLVRAAAWVAGEGGTPVRHVRLSFDGFDPDQNAAIPTFAEHQLRMHESAAAGDAPASLIDKQALLSEVAGLIPTGFLGAAAVSFLLKAAISVVDVRALLRSTVPVLPGPRAPSQDHLRAILDFVTREERLVLVLPADELPEPSVRWFVHEPRRNRRLSVVLIKARVPEAFVLYGEPLGPVVELGQMTPAMLRERLDLRFSPNTFPDRFYSGVWKRTQGVPGQVALAMMTLEHAGAVTRGAEQESSWHLAFEPADPRLVEYFAGQFYEQLNQVRDRQRPIDLHLVRFVELAALCGSIAPPRLITSYIGLTDAERDDLLDRVDELEEAGRPVFVSLDYRHPTFRDEQSAPELVYRFTDESNRLIVLRRMMHKSREAKSFLAYLSGRFPVVTRGTAELFASLASYLEDGSEEQGQYARRLHWWIAEEEADALVDLLAKHVEAGALSTDVLWAVAERSREWPPVRRLALLDAMQADPDGIPLDRLAAYYHVRAAILLDLGRCDEARLSCQAALQRAAPGDYSLRGLVCQIAHRCSHILYLFDEALEYACEHYRILALMDRLHGVEGAIVASHMAWTLIQLGRRGEAGPYLDEALACAAEISDTDQASLGIVMNELGLALRKKGDTLRGIECYRRSVLAHERNCGPQGPYSHVYVTRLCNLGIALSDSGEVDEAYECLVKAVTVAEGLTGITCPETPVALVMLFATDLVGGDAEALRKWTLMIQEMLESGPPEIVALLRRNARRALSLRQVEDANRRGLSEEAQQVIDALWEPDSLRGSEVMADFQA
jgi:tetratricopeptide (TPR) repeat protein